MGTMPRSASKYPYNNEGFNYANGTYSDWNLEKALEVLRAEAKLRTGEEYLAQTKSYIDKDQ